MDCSYRYFRIFGGKDMPGCRDDRDLDIGYPIHHQREGRIEAHMSMLRAPRYAPINQ